MAARTPSTLLAALVIGGGVACAVAAPPFDIGQRDPTHLVGDATVDVLDRTSTFGSGPAVTRLDPALLAALERAAADSAADGIRLHVNSGWRSPEHQAQLLADAIDQYGSAEEAARWVATPETSVHVSGDAVDIGPAEAAAWLAEHGSAYGLCQVYVNEPWHYELFPEAPDDGCPRRYADPTEDPRMHE